MCYNHSIFPCCQRDKHCHGDDCCSCCTDCDAVVCCCLEIRLVSNKIPATASKYAPTTQNIPRDKNDSSKKSNHLQKDAYVRKKTSNQSGQKSELPSTKNKSVKTRSLPPAPASARSASQIEVSYTDRTSKQHISGAIPATTTTTAAVKHQKPSGKTELMKTRSLPETPRTKSTKGRKLSSAQEKEVKETEASDLKEVPVNQQSSLSHSHLYESALSLVSGSVYSGSDLILGLSPHYDGVSQVVSLDGSYVPLTYSHGTILDGSGTHRTMVAGSSLSVHFEEHIAHNYTVTSTSARPLPGPPVR